MPVVVAVAGFAAGEVGGYAVRALQGLREVVGGGAPRAVRAPLILCCLGARRAEALRRAAS